MRAASAWLALVAVAAVLLGVSLWRGHSGPVDDDPAESAESTPLDEAGDPAAREALRSAQVAAAEAQARAARLAAQAAGADAAEGRARARLAQLAAALQAAEAHASVAEMRLAALEQDRRRIQQRLARQQEPVVRLTAALQLLASRPLALSALQPRSLRDVVYLRAVLAQAVPAVRARTAALRRSLERSRQLARDARSALQDLRRTEEGIAAQRTALLAEAARSRTVSTQAAAAARREAERAEEIAADARSLDDLLDEFDRIARQRAVLAALPGPVPRPDAGAAASAPLAPAMAEAPPTLSSSGPRGFRLPVVGRIVSGFGDGGGEGAARRQGLTLVPRPAAMVVAPAAGRVAFAGGYRGFGNVVIVEHGGGWVSLVTGMGGLSVEAGQAVDAGEPLGAAPGRRPEIALELRRDGEPVDPLPIALRDGR